MPSSSPSDSATAIRAAGTAPSIASPNPRRRPDDRRKAPGGRDLPRGKMAGEFSGKATLPILRAECWTAPSSTKTKGSVMHLNPYLFFNGQCEAAFKFYAKVIGGKIEPILAHEGTPAAEHGPAEWRGTIRHAPLVIGAKALMAAEAPPCRS